MRSFCLRVRENKVQIIVYIFFIVPTLSTGCMKKICIHVKITQIYVLVHIYVLSFPPYLYLFFFHLLFRYFIPSLFRLSPKDVRANELLSTTRNVYTSIGEWICQGNIKEDLSEI